MSSARSVVLNSLVAVGLLGCAAAAVVPDTPKRAPEPASRPVAPITLRNTDFEANPVQGRPCPPSWWCTMHNDPDSFQFGLASEPGSRGRFLKITRVKPEPWALVTQVVPATGLASRRLRVSADVFAEALDGGAGLLVMLQGPGGRVIGQRKVLLERGPGWRRAVAEIDVVSGTELVEIGLIIEGGGSVGFDDVQAAVVPAAGT
jgi:hypothetical protein